MGKETVGFVGVGLEKVDPRGTVVELCVGSGSLECRSRSVDGGHVLGLPFGGRDRESARVAEQIQDSVILDES